MTLALVLSFSTLVFLTLVALLWSRWPAWLKGLLVVGVTLFYFYANDVVHNMWGWPASIAKGAEFVMPTAK